MTETHDQDLRLLRLPQVLELIPIGRSSLYRLINEKAFPPPRKIGGMSLWSRQDIRAWIDIRFESESAKGDDSDPVDSDPV